MSNFSSMSTEFFTKITIFLKNEICLNIGVSIRGNEFQIHQVPVLGITCGQNIAAFM